MLTDRLEVRDPVEEDRGRFVELFGDDEFMVFSGGVLDMAAANLRFDHMLELAIELPYAKRPIVERATGLVVGYAGIDRFEFEGAGELEFGWRLISSVRGVGYATEAAQAIMAVLERDVVGTVYAMIAPTNEASKSVAQRLGFEFWKLATIDGYLDEIHRREIR